jgi:quercetin dioxygenase-like cupin family protein
MKVIQYRQISPKIFEGNGAAGVTGRVAIGKGDGAGNFVMRIFEVSPGGHTPKHTHDWEHEVFAHCGKGEVFSGGAWHPFETGDAVFIPANEEHQIRNSGEENLLFLCLIPAKAPEL